MKPGNILILTLLISVAICQDETDRKQERGIVTNAVGLGIGVIFGIVFGVVFVVCIFVSICCLPCCMVGCQGDDSEDLKSDSWVFEVVSTSEETTSNENEYSGL
jgi:hypothetical protein